MLLPASDTQQAALPEDEPRAFVLRIRLTRGAGGSNVVVTIDDVSNQRKSHFANLESVFAEIRRALNQSGPAPGQPH
jgi:hypothetical protein